MPRQMAGLDLKRRFSFKPSSSAGTGPRRGGRWGGSRNNRTERMRGVGIYKLVVQDGLLCKKNREQLEERTKKGRTARSRTARTAPK